MKRWSSEEVNSRNPFTGESIRTFLDTHFRRFARFNITYTRRIMTQTI